MGKVALKLRREHDDRGYVTTRQWKESEPFFLNPRGLLIHRVASAGSILYGGKRHHDYVHYLCGNQTTAAGEFLATPPKDRLLCEMCEFAAKRKGMKSADKIARRHVHVGRIKVEQTCCRHEKESN